MTFQVYFVIYGIIGRPIYVLYSHNHDIIHSFVKFEEMFIPADFKDSYFCNRCVEKSKLGFVE